MVKNHSKVFYLLIITIAGIIPTILFCNPFWILAFAWSGFLGVFAFDIHWMAPNLDYENISNAKKVHQFIFNFGLALLGWIIIFNLPPLDYIIAYTDTGDLILLGVAIVSLSGYLPKLVATGNPFNK